VRLVENKCICVLSIGVVISDISIHLLMFYNILPSNSGLMFPVHVTNVFIQCWNLFGLFSVLLYPNVNCFTLFIDEVPVLMWDTVNTCGTVSETCVDGIYTCIYDWHCLQFIFLVALSHLFRLDRWFTIQRALNSIDCMGSKLQWRHESALPLTVHLIQRFNLKYERYVTLVSMCLSR
jgi:hypothetical protein